MMSSKTKHLVSNKIQLHFFWKGLLLFICTSSAGTIKSQTCGFLTSSDGCPNTNYNNAFINSTNDFTTIEYDNWVSTVYSTVVRRYDGQFMVWGEDMASDGVSNIFTPQFLNSANYPALGSAKVLKVTGASYFNVGVGTETQFIALAANGLYAWGTEGVVLTPVITAGITAFQKLTVAGNATGLPPGVTPADVKMLTAARSSLCLVTCNGDIWMLSRNQIMRGAGGTGASTSWARVLTSAPGNPSLVNIVAVRVQERTIIALAADNTIWTWGISSYLGNGASVTINRNQADQMTKPNAGTIKMIGVASNNTSSLPAYYVLMTDGNLYSLGINDLRQLGDWTTTERLNWVQPRYNSATGPVMNNISWIAPNENDPVRPAVNVLTLSRTLYSFGSNNGGMIGRGGASSADPGIPDFLSGFTDIVAVETGGHTSMISRCGVNNTGFVGSSFNTGAMGNGNAVNPGQGSYIFMSNPVIPICGASNFAQLTPDPSVIPAFQTVNTYSVTQKVKLFFSPAGGTLSVVSGPGIIGMADTLSFTGAGTVVLQYNAVNPVCGSPTSTQISLQVSAGTLPFHLLELSAAMQSCKTLLSWQTDYEENTDRFEIEQSSNGTSWQKAGTVAALNNILGGTYSFTVQPHGEHVMLYRLKMVDKDDSYTYSKTITNKNNCAGSETALRVAPNPVSSESNIATVMIYGSYRGRAMLVLYNNLGQKLVTKTINLTGNGNTEQIKMPEGAKGQYSIQLTDVNGNRLCPVQKIIKQ